MSSETRTIGEKVERKMMMDHLERIESKLDFMLRQQARKESVPLAPTAYSALAQAGMDPRQLQTHKVVTLLDDWRAEQNKPPEHPGRFGCVLYLCDNCQKATVSQVDAERYWCSNCGKGYSTEEVSKLMKKEDGDERR